MLVIDDNWRPRRVCFSFASSDARQFGLAFFAISPSVAQRCPPPTANMRLSLSTLDKQWHSQRTESKSFRLGFSTAKSSIHCISASANGFLFDSWTKEEPRALGRRSNNLLPLCAETTQRTHWALRLAPIQNTVIFPTDARFENSISWSRRYGVTCTWLRMKQTDVLSVTLSLLRPNRFSGLLHQTRMWG